MSLLEKLAGTGVMTGLTILAIFGAIELAGSGAPWPVLGSLFLIFGSLLFAAWGAIIKAWCA